MATAAEHGGVSESDPRNRGVTSYFEPKQLTIDRTRELLRQSLPRASADDIEHRVRQVVTKIVSGSVRPPAPISQSLGDVSDPWYGLGTHPDIIERMWRLDETLPQACRWVFWGKPALVHPMTGIVFAVGYGTIGYAMRLPAEILKGASEQQARIIARGNPGQSFDIGRAGPEWRFITPHTAEAAWCKAAYDFAGAPT